MVYLASGSILQKRKQKFLIKLQKMFIIMLSSEVKPSSDEGVQLCCLNSEKNSIATIRRINYSRKDNNIGMFEQTF